MDVEKKRKEMGPALWQFRPFPIDLGMSLLDQQLSIWQMQIFVSKQSKWTTDDERPTQRDTCRGRQRKPQFTMEPAPLDPSFFAFVNSIRRGFPSLPIPSNIQAASHPNPSSGSSFSCCCTLGLQQYWSHVDTVLHVLLFCWLVEKTLTHSPSRRTTNIDDDKAPNPSVFQGLENR